MSLRNSTKTPKEPKAKKEKAPKALKKKRSKKEEDSVSEFDAGAFGETDADTLGGFSPTASKKTKAKKAKAPVRKLPPDVYTLILLLSFIFFTAASLLMYFDLASYK